MKQTKIKALQSFGSPTTAFRREKEYEVEKSFADSLIKAGLAVAVEVEAVKSEPKLEAVEEVQAEPKPKKTRKAKKEA